MAFFDVSEILLNMNYFFHNKFFPQTSYYLYNFTRLIMNKMFITKKPQITPFDTPEFLLNMN
jgi:hypothetical protein